MNQLTGNAMMRTDRILRRELGEEYIHYRKIQDIRNMHGIQAVMPYEIEIRLEHTDNFPVPFSWLYGLGVWIRNWLFDHGSLTFHQFSSSPDFSGKYYGRRYREDTPCGIPGRTPGRRIPDCHPEQRI